MSTMCAMSRTIPDLNNLSSYKIIRDRELGNKNYFGKSEQLSRKIYSSLDRDQTFPLHKYCTDKGGVFNLEFSLDGRLLVAACEKRSVLMFDAANHNQIRVIEDAHTDCVNCIRFIDSNIFATCSDDTTIKLWDIRSFKKNKCVLEGSTKCKRNLHGHSNWVKNIEYIEKDQVMVTSAFDGSIYTWDLKSPTENNLLYNKVFMVTGLMRTKLTPDGSKMVLCTTSGYMIIIHDLNLETLSNDLRLFRPDLYRLMQLSDQTFPAATAFNYLFDPKRKRNRVEFIDDFPNSAEVIASLQIHPMGWCALSRNMNAEETETWTTVHDIQARSPEEYEDSYVTVDEVALPVDHPALDPNLMHMRPTDIWMGYITNSNLGLYRMSQTSVPDNVHTTMGIINSGLIGCNTFERHFRNYPNDRNRIVKNLPRLTHYVKEKAVGKGYIKESCFSNDGVIICSPYNKGVRLLGFNKQVQELCYCVPEKSQRLYTIVEMNDYHSSVVLTCKFNPKHYELVSGCRGGEIVWYKPIL